MIHSSHVLAMGFRSMIHCPLIIFLKRAIYNVFDTISPPIFVLIFLFYTRNSDYQSHAFARRVREHAPRNFICVTAI